MTLRRGGMKMFKTWPQSFLKSAVQFSVFGVVLFAVVCSAGTIQNRANIPQGVGPINTNTAGKTQPRRVMHPAFANAGQTAGLQIWRIENFEPVPYPPRDYGKFYTGDSYIVLNTKADKNNRLSWDVHFWLGSETTQDEAGAAAILTVQLDDLLNGAPVQHREVQDHESSLFLGYFRNGIRYETGGVGGAFKHVQPNAPGEKRLFQVKGKRNVRVRQVNLSISSMNKGDCFILDAGNNIYVYVGATSKRIEKIKAISAANQIRDQDHSGRARVHIIDEFNTDNDREEFFNILGSGSPDQIPDESTAEDDAAFEANEERIVTLYKVTDQTGALKVDTISTKPLRQEMLDTNDCFILDTGTALFVWVGKRATQQEKSQAMVKAQDFLHTKKYPAWTQVHRIVEGAESAPFKQYFATWRDAGMAATRLIRAVKDISVDEDDEVFLQALKKSGGRALGFMPDNGKGEVVGVWRFGNGEIEEVPSDQYSSLAGIDSYVIKYIYDDENSQQAAVIYYWLGRDSSDQDKDSAAEKAESYATDGSVGKTIVARITQGHEPRHFRKIFNGKLVTFYSKDNNVAIYRVRGTESEDVITEEVGSDSSLLASDDSFVIVSPEILYVWNGAGASGFEKSQGITVANQMGENIQVIEEGSEPEEFWELLGGKQHYDLTINPPGPPILESRLFHCKILPSGRFKFEEIQHYGQEDLDVDDIMILDGGDEIYSWAGEGSTQEEETKSFKMAMDYVQRDPTARTSNTVPLIKIKQSHEPGCFRRLFPSWSDDLWESLPSYEDVKKQISEANAALNDI